MRVEDNIFIVARLIVTRRDQMKMESRKATMQTLAGKSASGGWRAERLLSIEIF
jgi:hypothetical protein